MTQNRAPRIPLPKGWTQHVRSAVVHVISLAQFTAVDTRSWAVDTRSWAVDSMNGRVRLEAENDPLREEVAQLREEGRIKDARMARIPAPRRPHDSPIDRLEILQLRVVRRRRRSLFTPRPRLCDFRSPAKLRRGTTVPGAHHAHHRLGGTALDQR